MSDHMYLVCRFCDKPFPPAGLHFCTKMSSQFKTRKRGITGAQVLAVGGILAACVGTVGTMLGNVYVVGSASVVMLLTNVLCLCVDKRRDNGNS